MRLNKIYYIYTHILYMIILLTIVVELQTCTYPIAPRSPTSGRAVGYREESAGRENEREYYSAKNNCDNIFNELKEEKNNKK